MTIKSRRKLFYALVAAFFVLGLGSVLYVDGWRFDFATFGFKKVGAIFVRSFPRDARIYLDERLVKNDSGFFQDGTLVSGLFPKSYDLKLEADNYLPWRETVSVLPSLVTEAKNAVLIPKVSAVAATGTIKNFWLLGGNLVLQGEKDILTISDPPDQKKRIGSGEMLGATSDASAFLTKTANGAYYWNDIVNQKSINLTALFKKQLSRKNGELVVAEENNRKLILIEPTALSFLDAESGGITRVRATSKTVIANVAASRFLLAWTEWDEKENSSALTVYDIFLKRQRLDIPTFKGKNISLRWIKNDALAVLQDDGTLYTYNVTKSEALKIADDVKTFAFTENGSALAALEHNALEIFFFNQDRGYYRFRLPDVENAQDVSWYADESHLFVHYPDQVRFLDIKDSSLVNFAAVAETRLAKYDAENNRLYFVKDSKLSSLDFPR